MAVQLASRRKSISGLSVTPLIDIVFQLLIFFLLTANYLNVRVLNLELPGEASGATGMQSRMIFVHLDKGGAIRVNETGVELDKLSDQVREEAQGDPNAIVFIDAAKEAAVQLFVSVMDEVRSVGVLNVQVLDPASRELLLGPGN